MSPIVLYIDADGNHWLGTIDQDGLFVKGSLTTVNVQGAKLHAYQITPPDENGAYSITRDLGVPRIKTPANAGPVTRVAVDVLNDMLLGVESLPIHTEGKNIDELMTGEMKGYVERMGEDIIIIALGGLTLLGLTALGIHALIKANRPKAIAAVSFWQLSDGEFFRFPDSTGIFRKTGGARYTDEAGFWQPDIEGWTNPVVVPVARWR